MKRIIVCSLAVLFTVNLIASSPASAQTVTRTTTTSKSHNGRTLLYAGAVISVGLIASSVGIVEALDALREHEAEKEASANFVKDENSHIDDFEPYAKFDNETEEFETGIRYKIRW